MKTLKILIFILLIGIFVGNSTTYVNLVDSNKELTINNSNINIKSEFTVVSNEESVDILLKRRYHKVPNLKEPRKILLVSFINDS